MGMEAGDPRIDPYAGLEAWRWTGRGKLHVARFTGKYGEVEYHAVQGGRVFHLTPAERRLNSDKSYSDAVDPFRNGQCIPVSLSDMTPDADRERIAANPAILDDAAIDRLLRQEPTKLAKALDALSTPMTLVRIHERAEQLDVATSKVAAIRARIEQVDPASLGKGTEPIPIAAVAERGVVSVDAAMKAAVGDDAITVGI